MNAGEVASPLGLDDGLSGCATFLNDMWYGASRYNRPRWKNAEYDKLIDQALTEPDEAKRFVLYHKAERILVEDSAPRRCR